MNDLLPFQFNFANSRMLIPMILESLARDFEPGTALLHPVCRLPSVAGHQTTYVSNPVAFGNDSGLRQDPAAQRGNDFTYSC
jgi:hypothetical protein